MIRNWLRAGFFALLIGCGRSGNTAEAPRPAVASPAFRGNEIQGGGATYADVDVRQLPKNGFRVELFAGGNDAERPLRNKNCQGGYFAQQRPDIVLRNSGDPVVVRLFATPVRDDTDLGIVAIPRDGLPRCVDDTSDGLVEEMPLTVGQNPVDVWVSMPTAGTFARGVVHVVTEGVPASWAADALDIGSKVGTKVKSGSTADEPDHAADLQCEKVYGDGARDAVLRWTAPADGAYAVDTRGSDYDTLLYAWRWNAPDAGSWCNDDMAASDSDRIHDPTGESQIALEARRGEVFAIVVDGARTSDYGHYQVNIQRTKAASPQAHGNAEQ
jgi:hypothetical protein